MSIEDKKQLREAAQRDMDLMFGVRVGIKTGDLVKSTDPTTKKDVEKQVDVLKEALYHYRMVDAWVWRGYGVG